MVLSNVIVVAVAGDGDAIVDHAANQMEYTLILEGY